jgi:tRNA pseudouridine32 synthase/23S rRNA pseudouridine746 synthase
MSTKIEIHLTVTHDKMTAVEALAEKVDLSKQKIKQAMQKGCVWIEQENQTGQLFTQRIRRAKKSMHMGDVLHLYYDESVLATEPKDATLIKDLGAYSVWNKPTGMLSQGSKWGDHCTIYRWAEKHLTPERPAFIVHRLDRAANGLILIAHNKRIATALSSMFAKREIEKHYRVIVQGDFSQTMTLGADSLTIENELEGKAAISHIKLISHSPENNTSELDVQIETGRKHQVRKHLQDIKFPVIGDRLYGEGEHTLDLQLTASMLKFTCPLDAQVLTFEL